MLMNEVYRYRPPSDWLAKGIEQRTLFFCQAKKLNDPFDCQVDLMKAIKRAIAGTSGAKRRRLREIRDSGHLAKLQRGTENVGVCCFSLTENSSIMWSHYADEHRGVRLGYRFPDTFLSDEKNRVMGWGSVVYDDNCITEWFVKFAADTEGVHDVRFQAELVKLVISSKHSDWGYEQEWRGIRLEFGALSVPASALTSVCFGLRTEPGVEKDVRDAVAISGASVDFFRVCRSESDFGLSVRPIR